jgi:methionyl-tRNA formyltransferase
MKTLFFGTPELAVPFLELLAKKTQLLAIVTTPDEPSGRGYAVHPPPVKQVAEKLKLPVLQPMTLKDNDFLDRLSAYSPDVVFVVAYGKILPPELLKIPRQGFINVHFSLLPLYRGAAPIQRALMQGEKRTGVSLFWLDEGMDTGPLFLQKEIPIREDDDADTLRGKLIPLGLEALQEVLDLLTKGQVIRTPQSGPSSLAPSLKKDEGKIDWNQPATVIVSLIRGTTPWPGAYTFLNSGGKSQRLKILRAQAIPTFPAENPAKVGGVVGLESSKGFIVKCGREFLQIHLVQPEGKRPMSAWDFWQGARLKLGEILG